MRHWTRRQLRDYWTNSARLYGEHPEYFKPASVRNGRAERATGLDVG